MLIIFVGVEFSFNIYAHSFSLFLSHNFLPSVVIIRFAIFSNQIGLNYFCTQNWFVSFDLKSRQKKKQNKIIISKQNISQRRTKWNEIKAKSEGKKEIMKRNLLCKFLFSSLCRENVKMSCTAYGIIVYGLFHFNICNSQCAFHLVIVAVIVIFFLRLLLRLVLFLSLNKRSVGWIKLSRILCKPRWKSIRHWLAFVSFSILTW